MWRAFQRWRSYDEKISGRLCDYRTLNNLPEGSVLYVNSYDKTIKIVSGSGVSGTFDAQTPVEELSEPSKVQTYGIAKTFVFLPDDPSTFLSAIDRPVTSLPVQPESDTLYLYDPTSESYRVHSIGTLAYDPETSVIAVRNSNGSIILSQRIKPEFIALDPYYRSATWTYILNPPDSEDRIPEALTWVWGFRFATQSGYGAFVYDLFTDFSTEEDDVTSSSDDDESPQNFSSEEIHSDISLSDSPRAYACSNREVDAIRSEGVVRVAEFKSDPKQIMLYDRDRSIIAPTLDGLDIIDVGSESVVRSWTDLDHPISKVAHSSKNARLDAETTFKALSSLGVMTFDPRTKKGISSLSTYGTNSRPYLSCLATTANGDVVIGSRTGQIRLYDPLAFSRDRAPRAKNTYSGFGDPILAVDVTSDGSRVLCTCATYLIVIQTIVDGESGFETSLGSDRPEPLRLSLNPEDAEELAPLRFSKAKFDSLTGSKIVTSTGNHIIVWYGLYDGTWSYEIRNLNRRIVDKDFLIDTTKPIAATTTKLVM